MKNNITVLNGQVNFAKGNAIINVIQNNNERNSENREELDIIIKAIKKDLPNLKKDEANKIEDLLDMTEEELTRLEPRQSRLQKCIALSTTLIKCVKNIPTLITNLKKLQNFVINFINKLE